MKNYTYKKILFVAICILGLLSISSCRSMKSSCGLAEQSEVQQTYSSKQIDVTRIS